jgi:hypothetical protein
MPDQPAGELDECEQVTSRRFDEALAAGLSPADAHLFAVSSYDIGLLRKLAAAGCDPDTIRRIVL